MKKYCAFGLFVCLCTLSSCNRKSIFSSQISSSKKEEDTIKKIQIGSLPTNTTFYIYDNFDFTGLVINEVTYDKNNNYLSSKEINDYTIYDENEKEIKEGDFIDSSYLKGEETSTITLTISKEGCSSISFSLFVEPIKNFSQRIVLPSDIKTVYALGEKFESKDLNLSLVTSYRTNKRVTKSEELKDYTIDLEKGTDTYQSENYTFTKEGAYNVSISCEGYEDVISASYHIYVQKEEQIDLIKNLSNKKDDSIKYETDSTKMTVSFENTSKESSDKGYYSSDEVENTYNLSSIRNRNYYKWRYLPTKGDVPLLVIPILTPGDENKANETNLDKINTAFFGDSDELGFESVRSYYYQSSYEQLNLTGGVTSYFDPSLKDAKYKTLSGYTSDSISKIPALAYEWAVETYHIDPKKYDSDKDGYIDGIWLIYLHSYDRYDTDRWWAYTSSTQSTDGTIDNPKVNNYAWASVDFINGTFSKEDSENKNIDAHVLIHETGHMFGLKDYYSYGNDSNYSPLGAIDMMAQNLSDQNPYSKLLLGWVNPYIAYGSGTITLSSNQSKNALIVFPYDEKTYKKNKDNKIIFNSFDEYLVMDYYTYKNLNKHDYYVYNVKAINANGGRLYHVDNRLTTAPAYSGCSFFDDPDEPFTTKTNETVNNTICNTDSGYRAESAYGLTDADAFDEIRWIDKSKNYLSLRHVADSASLFYKNDTFNISSYKNQFNVFTSSTMTYYLNSKNTFSTTFKIVNIQ